MEGLKNLLQWINDNWSLLIMIFGLAIGVYQKAKKYLSTSTEEKIEQAKKELKQRILKFVSDAEEDYSDWVKAGSIKRSQVIGEIFLEYPILSKVVNQEDLIKWIDNEINNALDTLRKVIDENQ